MLDARRDQNVPAPQPPLGAAHALERTPLSDNSCVLRQVVARKAAQCRVWSLAAQLPRQRG
jgi:hypothetical protein